jgi:putative hydrolase of the HAD superfamily
MTAVTFDFGQTLAELDSTLLAERLQERGVTVDPARVDAMTLGAWGEYNVAKRQGAMGETAWKVFMRTLLTRSGVSDGEAEACADWLWTEQPHKNLWRRAVDGMLELARELRRRDVPVGVLSNSEGRLAELIEELSWDDAFTTITDSGRLPFEKPDPRIFEHTAQALGVEVHQLIHVGDAWEADVKGALKVGARAIYFSPEPPDDAPAGVTWCRDHVAVRDALKGFCVELEE